MRCMILVLITLVGLAPSSLLADGEEGRQRRQPSLVEHTSGCKVSIVTGASSNHFRSLLNLLDSLHEEIGPSPHHNRDRDSSNEQRGNGMDISVIVYDIGLLDREKQVLDQHLKGLGIRAESRKFDFMAWPPHVQDLDCRAWKPIIFHNALKDADTAIWMDAGCLVSDGGPPARRPRANVLWRKTSNAMLVRDAMCWQQSRGTRRIAGELEWSIRAPHPSMDSIASELQRRGGWHPLREEADCGRSGRNDQIVGCISTTRCPLDDVRQ